MPELAIDIPIKNLAHMISRMNKQDMETLYMYLTDEGQELQKRNTDLVQNKVKYLNENEVFDV
ncbi:MAG: hypothetical protein KKB05_04230 [Proteobacteria bacterium]|jgi:hypothetical protein|nr:hypothetical protein [Pseudomonadota bacterium]MBU4463134.1 hypothetical protein [Pseudomonadota bacterium]